MTERSETRKVSQDSYCRLFQHLTHVGPASARSLAGISDLHIVTVYDLLRALHSYKVVHIAAWEKDSRGRDAIAVFALGPGDDAKRQTKSRTQIARDYRARKKALAAAAPAEVDPRQMELAEAT